MRNIEGSYRALLAVTNALNSQRDTDGLWHVITEQIKKVVPWERAGVTLYSAESDSSGFTWSKRARPHAYSSGMRSSREWAVRWVGSMSIDAGTCVRI